MRVNLRASTSIMVGLAVGAGSASFAQGQRVPNCGIGAGVPCVVADTGERITRKKFEALERCTEGVVEGTIPGDVPCATGKGDVFVGLDAEQRSDEPVTGEAAAPAGEAADATEQAGTVPAADAPPAEGQSLEQAAPAADATPAEDLSPEERALQQALQQNEDQQADRRERRRAAAAEAAQDEPAAEAAAEAPPAAEAAPEAEPEQSSAAMTEAGAEPEATEEAASAEDLSPEQRALQQALQQKEDEQAVGREERRAARAAAQEAPAAEAAAEAAPAAEPEQTEQRSAAATEPAAEPEAEQQATSAEDLPPEQRALQQALQQKEEEQAERRAAAADAAAAEQPAAAAATAGEGDAAVAEVEQETVTEQSARSSAEEFETAPGAQQDTSTRRRNNAGARSNNDNNDDDDGNGLSNFEKALIVGLGSAVVGQLLSNGDEVVSNSGDRVVVLRDGEYRVLKDDDTLLRQPGNDVKTERFSDGSARETVTRPNGVQIVTIRGADGRVLRRTRVFPDGQRIVLFDDTQESVPVDFSELPDQQVEPVVVSSQDEDALRRALETALASGIDRQFSLRQVREIREVRELAPEIEVDAITFETGSSAIRPDQAQQLASLGRSLRELIEERPNEVFLIEGHTDAVGAAEYNLALSDRRAESVALALTEYFDVPPENLVVQGYGEAALKIPTEQAERENRRATVRRITPLLDMEFASNL